MWMQTKAGSTSPPCSFTVAERSCLCWRGSLMGMELGHGDGERVGGSWLWTLRASKDGACAASLRATRGFSTLCSNLYQIISFQFTQCLVAGAQTRVWHPAVSEKGQARRADPVQRPCACSRGAASSGLLARTGGSVAAAGACGGLIRPGDRTCSVASSSLRRRWMPRR